MKRLLLVFLSCLMVFTLVITASAGNNDPGGVKKEVLIDMTSHPEDIEKPNNIGNTDDRKNQKETVSNDNSSYNEDIGNKENPSADNNATSNDSSLDSNPDEDKDTSESIDTDSGKTEGDPKNTVEESEEQNEAETITPEPVESVNIKLNITPSGIKENLLLVNKSNVLESKYVPSGLVYVSPVVKEPVIPSKKSGIMLKPEALTALNNMYAAACKAGKTDMILSSGYRNYAEQNALFSRKVAAISRGMERNEAKDKAATVVAPPGRSEHQTGLSVDLTTKLLLKRSDPLIDEFANTTCGKWLVKNSWKYGYILRYQTSKINITGIINEPWHYRFVGSPHAELMNKNGLCLEEYEKFLKDKARISFTDYLNNKYEIAYINLPAGSQVLNIAIDKGSTVEVSKIKGDCYVVTVKKANVDKGI